VNRALLVGIDAYDRFSALSGCVNDVAALAPLLSRHQNNDVNFECRTLTTGTARVERDHLLRELAALLEPAADIAVLYFAGHGREESADVSLVTSDGTEHTPGVPLSEVLGRVRQSPVAEVNIILDCCFSGAAAGIPQLGVGDAAVRRGVSLLTASRADEPSAETAAGRGLFSTYLEGALDGGAADVLGKVTMPGVYSYLSECFTAWEQRPMFKANIDHPHVLRRCEPAVPLEGLRELATLFPEQGFVYSLDPSYEPDQDVVAKDPEHQRIFAVLQKMRAAKLVDTIDSDHLYYAAMESKACRLTPLGELYRLMAAQDRI